MLLFRTRSLGGNKKKYFRSKKYFPGVNLRPPRLLSSSSLASKQDGEILLAANNADTLLEKSLSEKVVSFWLKFRKVVLNRKKFATHNQNKTHFGDPRAAMSNSILQFATNLANEFGHSPHYSQQVLKNYILSFQLQS